MEIAVVGEKEFTTGFRLGGVRMFCEVDGNDFIKKFEECLAAEGIGIIIVEEKFYKNLPQRIKRKLEKLITPVVLGISEEAAGGTDLKELIKRCLGVDLWSK